MEDIALVSIIVPVYNAQNTIQRCVESCLAQIYKNIEIIVIDDGSEDNSYPLLLELSKVDSRIQVIHCENGGVCKARNIGLDNAKGEFIVFVDADDTLEVDAVWTLLNLLNENKCDIVVGQHRIKRGDSTEDMHYKEKLCLWKGTDAIEELLKDNPATYAVWGRMYRRDIIGNVRFVVGRKTHEDSYFNFNIFMKKPTVIVIDKVVYDYYAEENSVSRAVYSDRLLDIFYFSKEKKEIIDELLPQYSNLANNVLVKADMAYLSYCIGNNVKGVEEIEKQCIGEIKRYRKYFVPMTPYNNRLFFIIRHNLYFPYKHIQKLRTLLK